MTTHTYKSRIIIIGANFAGLTAASKIDKHHLVTVIDARADFQWTPNIHEMLSDVKKQDYLSLPLTTLISKLGHHFIQQTVKSVNNELKTVSLNDGQTLDYDVLLIASGHSRTSYGITGADKYAIGFRQASDALAINNKIQASINSNTSTIINIIGGGFTGVEVLGELLRKYPKNTNIKLNIVESSSSILQSLPSKLANDIIEQCNKLGVHFYFNKAIKEVKNASICFDDNSTVQSDITIWTAGTKLPDYLLDLNANIVANGLPVNRYLQAEGFDSIFVAGDSASYSSPLPKQASNAMDMGLHAAENINRFCKYKTMLPFTPKTKPILLSLGDINTYLIQKNLVLASPLLAAAKEAVYQLYMARLSSLLPIEQGLSGIAGRFSLSTEKLLLAEVLKARPKVLLGRSKVLY
ncbi:NAD(P)/FAD-dependent oxidoreductase [Glaciecola petra]|uniref:FAD-dependent oxidoreductase n=1 Tax=Glaciecola petra TaxID=3075602 RepID=A0ABU2ZNC3_9ALTE|nr:FAD-dependent oxidoreductase [Aestuariibacter sp. P117]MDT0594132.1 FAD-dependent oxidoreductase [Aestuariibacter sp. P117]